MNGLNMKIPDTSFSITDVRNLDGSKRVLEVMNTATQSNAEMTLKDWEEWWTAPDRDETKLNVISLEFSNTKMESYVTAPKVVRQVDWVDHVWPKHLKEDQEDGKCCCIYPLWLELCIYLASIFPAHLEKFITHL